MRIALLHEHPTWSVDLIRRAADREFDLAPIDITTFDLMSIDPDQGFDVWVNRINAMPSAGRPPSVVAAAGHLLASLEMQCHTVINGSLTHRIGGSKAAQAALFERLGLGTPRTIAIYQASGAVAAAEQVGFPVLTKPNVGGSGAGIVQHDSVQELQASIAAEHVDLGIDGTGVVQPVIDSADGMIYRVEMLGDELFYGTKQRLQAGTYNYCAADGCAIEPDAEVIQLFTPAPAIVESAARVMRATNTRVGGVEYLIDASNGHPSFFDFNPYSNFVTGFEEQLGFNPIDRYLDFIFTPSGGSPAF